eukprot:353314-Prorocentrum_minimum.AAC.1
MRYHVMLGKAYVIHVKYHVMMAESYRIFLRIYLAGGIGRRSSKIRLVQEKVEPMKIMNS